MDTYQKIMVALDLSAESEAVLHKARLIAGSLDARATVPAASALVTKHTDRDTEKENATAILVFRNFFMSISRIIWGGHNVPVL